MTCFILLWQAKEKFPAAIDWRGEIQVDADSPEQAKEKAIQAVAKRGAFKPSDVKVKIIYDRDPRTIRPRAN